MASNFEDLNNEQRENHSSEQSFKNTPKIPESVYENLPAYPKQLVNLYPTGSRERDVFLTALLVAFAGSLFNIHGIYRKKKVYATLFCLIAAPPANGKGVVADVKHVLQPFHDYLVSQMPRVWLLMPGNISEAKLINLLRDNNSKGIIIESEIDTFIKGQKQKWGNINDIIRLIFHGEDIGIARKKDDELFIISDARMGIAVSGTFMQAKVLLGDTENGSYSRYIMYCFQQANGWVDVTNEDSAFDIKANLVEHGQKIIELHTFLNQYPYEFKVSDTQWNLFNEKFRGHLNESLETHGDEIESTVYRLGLITFRMAMILSAIRKWEMNNTDAQFECSDVDFITALTLSSVYLEHSKAMLNLMPEVQDYHSSARNQNFINALPNEFTKSIAQQIARQTGLSDRTMYRIFNRLMTNRKLKQTSHGHYKKI